MRIVSGRLGGRRLRAPAGAATRPTTERVREAVFSILGAPAPETHVLDLFAGSGALGLEALSRGAATVTFVDSSRSALEILRANLDDLGVARQARVVAADAVTAVRRPAPAPYRWVFIDPPYRSDLARAVLDILGAEPVLGPEHPLYGVDGAAGPGSLTADVVVIVEHDRRNPPLDRHGSLIRTDSRRYGDTVIAFFHRADPPCALPSPEP